MLPSASFAQSYQQSLYEIRMHVENYAKQQKVDASQSKVVKVSGKRAVEMVTKVRPSAFTSSKGKRILEWLVKDDNARAVYIEIAGSKAPMVLMPYAKGSPIAPQGIVITLEDDAGTCEYDGELGFINNGCVCAVACNRTISCGLCPEDEASFYGEWPNDYLSFDKFDIDEDLPLFNLK